MDQQRRPSPLGGQMQGLGSLLVTVDLECHTAYLELTSASYEFTSRNPSMTRRRGQDIRLSHIRILTRTTIGCLPDNRLSDIYKVPDSEVPVQLTDLWTW